MESMNEVIESAPTNVRIEAQRAVAQEYRTVMAGIDKRVVMERGYDN